MWDIVHDYAYRNQALWEAPSRQDQSVQVEYFSSYTISWQISISHPMTSLSWLSKWKVVLKLCTVANKLRHSIIQIQFFITATQIIFITNSSEQYVLPQVLVKRDQAVLDSQSSHLWTLLKSHVTIVTVYPGQHSAFYCSYHFAGVGRVGNYALPLQTEALALVVVVTGCAHVLLTIWKSIALQFQVFALWLHVCPGSAACPAPPSPLAAISRLAVWQVRENE